MKKNEEYEKIKILATESIENSENSLNLVKRAQNSLDLETYFRKETCNQTNVVKVSENARFSKIFEEKLIKYVSIATKI